MLPFVIERRARETPDDALIIFDPGAVWTCLDAYRWMLRTATGLDALGVTRGDRVLCWLPGGPDLMAAWLGVNQLGAIYVPINLAYRGQMLAHILSDAQARVLIIHESLVERLADIVTPPDLRIVVLGAEGGSDGEQGVSRLAGGRPELFPVAHDPAVRVCPAEPWDPYAIIYTSGTTGPSKGVVSSYLHIWATGALSFGSFIRPDDRFLATLPLFHAGGTIAVVFSIVGGASVVVPDAFTTSGFWDLVRRTETTMTTLVGVMASFLLGAPEQEGDRDNPLRLASVIPLTRDAQRFAERFDVDIVTGFNMTEINCPLMSDLNPTAVGTCGRPRAGVEVRVVDAYDRPAAAGQTGELIVRADMPWTLNSGYWNNPQATAHAWRNGWFHTGDAFRVDEAGEYFFVDRIKDAIRRRGENISSFEVEAEVLTYPGVREAAAVGVPAADGEDEVLVVVAGDGIEPPALHEHLMRRLPHFMTPRYIRVANELPKTQTSKVEKHRLRAQGVTPDTWDREAAGVIVRRERIGAGAKR